MKSTNNTQSTPKREKVYFLEFMNSVIDEFLKLGKTRTAETYFSTMKSISTFTKGKDFLIKKLDKGMMLSYQKFLLGRGLNMNSISFYNRIIRATYNRAIAQGIVKPKDPFKHVYTGVDKTLKRSISLKNIKHLKKMDLPFGSIDEFARDIFLFSFYTRGMSFIDIAYLQKKDIKNGVLQYRRKKTGQLLFIEWEKCMEEIVKRYNNPKSQWLFPILDNNERGERDQYIYFSHTVNRSLKRIGKSMGLKSPLTMYVARHSWASIAQNKKIPLSIISKGMGHDSEETTRIYLNSIDNSLIDRANKRIIKLL